jgi:hypothetical protein
MNRGKLVHRRRGNLAAARRWIRSVSAARSSPPGWSFSAGRRSPAGPISAARCSPAARSVSAARCSPAAGSVSAARSSAAVMSTSATRSSAAVMSTSATRSSAAVKSTSALCVAGRYRRASTSEVPPHQGSCCLESHKLTALIPRQEVRPAKRAVSVLPAAAMSSPGARTAGSAYAATSTCPASRSSTNTGRAHSAMAAASHTLGRPGKIGYTSWRTSSMRRTSTTRRSFLCARIWNGSAQRERASTTRRSWRSGGA